MLTLFEEIIFEVSFECR